jgi:hypothetical protein
MKRSRPALRRHGRADQGSQRRSFQVRFISAASRVRHGKYVLTKKKHFRATATQIRSHAPLVEQVDGCGLGPLPCAIATVAPRAREF